MAQKQACQFDDVTLLAYLRDAVPMTVRQSIEQSAVCRQAVEQLANEMRLLMPLLREAVCPPLELLIDYQEGRISGTPRLVVYQHLQRCQQCQAELAMFDAIDAVPTVAPTVFTPPAFVRRMVEALFQPPTASPVAVRGGMLFYHTPQIGIHLYSIKSPGKARTWVLQGLVRTVDEQPFTTCEELRLVSLDEPDLPPRQTTLDPTGAFRFSDLERGRYRLHLITAEEEIWIREISVG